MAKNKTKSQFVELKENPSAAARWAEDKSQCRARLCPRGGLKVMSTPYERPHSHTHNQAHTSTRAHTWGWLQSVMVWSRRGGRGGKKRKDGTGCFSCGFWLLSPGRCSDLSLELCWNDPSPARDAGVTCFLRCGRGTHITHYCATYAYGTVSAAFLFLGFFWVGAGGRLFDGYSKFEVWLKNVFHKQLLRTNDRIYNCLKCVTGHRAQECYRLETTYLAFRSVPAMKKRFSSVVV